MDGLPERGVFFVEEAPLGAAGFCGGGFAIGHTFGVRVQRVQKVQRIQRGRLTALWPKVVAACRRRVMSPQGKRLTMICASLVLLQIMFAVHRFAQGATAPAALRVADCLSGNDYKVSVTG